MVNVGYSRVGVLSARFYPILARKEGLGGYSPRVEREEERQFSPVCQKDGLMLLMPERWALGRREEGRRCAQRGSSAGRRCVHSVFNVRKVALLPAQASYQR